MNCRVLAVLGAALWLVGGPAAAEPDASYCVVCDGPQTLYRCELNAAGAVIRHSAGQLYCTVKIARAGGHKRCSARALTDGDCNGEVKRYSFKGLQDSYRGLAGGAQPGEAALQDERIPPPNQDTLVGLTRDVAGSTARTLGSAGEALSDATGTATRTVTDAASTAGRSLSGAARAAVDGARDAGDSVVDMTDNAGRVLRNVAIGAYDCVTSLFSKCTRRDPEPGAE